MSSEQKQAEEKPIGGEGGEPTDITQLPIEQLGMVKKQLENEIKSLAQNYHGLRAAKARFLESGKSLEAFTPENDKKPLLVPLSTSLYVPGQMGDINEVMVDIGTGYFVQKSVPDAKKYFAKKSSFIDGRMKQLEKVLLAKKQNAQSVVMVMQSKIAAASQQSAAQQQAA
jgi:prefoldin alpha subunit